MLKARQSISKFIDDDVPHVAPGFSTRRLKVLLAARSSGSSVGPLWKGQQVGTKHTVTIQQRVDCNLFMSILEQRRQVCQICLDAFSPLPDQTKQLPRDHTAIVQGMKISVPIAERFCAGELQRDELKSARDKAMLSKSTPGSASAEHRDSNVDDKQSKTAALSETKAAAKATATTKAVKAPASDAKKRPAPRRKTAAKAPRKTTAQEVEAEGGDAQAASAVEYEPLPPPPSEFFYEVLTRFAVG